MRQRGALGLLHVMQQRTGRGNGDIHALATETGKVFGAKLFGQHFMGGACVKLPIGQAFDGSIGNRGGKTFRHDELSRLQSFQLRCQRTRRGFHDPKAAARE